MRRSEATLKLAIYTPPTEEEVGIVSCQQHQGIASRHYPPSLPNSTPTDIYLQFYTDAFRPFNDTIVCTPAYFLRLTLPIRWCTASLMDDITAEATPPYLIMRTPPPPLTPLLPTLSTLSHKYTPPSTSPPRSPPTLISPVTPTIDLISPLPQPKLTPPPVHLPLPTPLPDPIHPLPDLPCDNPTSHPIPH
ncbi:hypothetical protein Pmani_001779 [Petrolisthes manimaculis]|uniref:Uncharacterized protein n=1 Tax=Petrolisthes manimaculis TaxID=1843537 RepID=A0AAE1UL22_9EUCA|nr:hypothetical protein Pmani_001779 [Petrolisthes manimaculis]